MNAVFQPSIVPTQESTIDSLGEQLAAAKIKELEAKQNRINIEDQIIELMGANEEGSRHLAGEQYQITTTGKLNRKIINPQGLIEALPHLISNRLVKTSYSFDIRELRFLENNEPDIYREFVAPYTEVKPAKIAVSVGPTTGKK